MTEREAVQVEYIGGPTAVIEFCGLRFLTDPTLDHGPAEYVTGPVTLKKLAGPRISADDLGHIDYVLLSHDQHSDNLDRIGRQFLSRAGKVLTTRDGAERLQGHAVGFVPWQTITVPTPDGGSLLLTAAPARHGPFGCEARSGPVIGFALRRAGDPRNSTLYVSGDTVWYEGVAEVAKWFRVTTAVLNMGAALVEAAGPAPLTMTADDAIQLARAMPEAEIVPLHFEGWAHFTEPKEVIDQAFRAAGLQQRLRWA